MHTPLDCCRAGFDVWLGVWKAQQALQEQTLLLMTGALLARQTEAAPEAGTGPAALLPLMAVPGPCGPPAPAARRRRRTPEAG